MLPLPSFLRELLLCLVIRSPDNRPVGFRYLAGVGFGEIHDVSCYRLQSGQTFLLGDSLQDLLALLAFRSLDHCVLLPLNLCLPDLPERPEERDLLSVGHRLFHGRIEPQKVMKVFLILLRFQKVKDC